MEVREVIIYLAVKYRGDFEKIFEAIKEKENVNEEEVKKVINNLKCEALTLVDHNYPEKLKNITCPPFCLFYYGDISLINHPTIISVVGSREASSYGINNTKRIVEELETNDIVIASGMALGIDRAAHEASLNKFLPTIAVLGCGIDNIYPKANFDIYKKIKTRGLIISEYPGDTQVEKNYFSSRNRIITGISKGIFVPELKERSGTMVSVKYGLEQGKEIFVLPHPPLDGTFNNSLIREGAKLIEDGKELIEDLS